MGVPEGKYEGGYGVDYFPNSIFKQGSVVGKSEKIAGIMRAPN